MGGSVFCSVPSSQFLLDFHRPAPSKNHGREAKGLESTLFAAITLGAQLPGHLHAKIFYYH